MENKIEIFRYFAVNMKSFLYVVNNRKLTLKGRREIKKYSDISLFNKAASRKKELYYLIYVNNAKAGYAYFTINRYYKQIYLEYIFVEDEYRRQGLAKLLFNKAIEEFKLYFTKIKTIQAVPVSLEGKLLLENIGFLPDVFYSSSGGRGRFSIYYLNEEDTLILDKEEYELVCGDFYNYQLVGVRKYLELVDKFKTEDPDFSKKNYDLYLKNFKKEREKRVKVKKTPNDSIFKIDNCSLDSFDGGPDLGFELEVVPCMFSQEYLDNYLTKMP